MTDMFLFHSFTGDLSPGQVTNYLKEHPEFLDHFQMENQEFVDQYLKSHADSLDQYLLENPEFLDQYLKRHPDYLERYLMQEVELDTLERWMIRRSQRDKQANGSSEKSLSNSKLMFRLQKRWLRF